MTPLQQTRLVSNTIASAANAAGQTALQQYCEESMHAIGREGRYSEGHCTAVGEHATDSVTNEQREDLQAIRVNWTPVFTAFETLRNAHNVLVESLNSAEDIRTGRTIELMGDLARAYNAFRGVTVSFGLMLPPLLGGSQ